MRICFVGMEIVPTDNGTFVGGLVNNVVRLAKGLSERGVEVHVITSDVKNVLEGGASFSWGEISPIRLHGEYASSGSGIEFLLKVMPTIAEKDSEESFDIVHVHSAYPLLAPIGSLSTLIRHIPAVFTLYSPIQTTPLRDRKGIYQSLSSLPISKFLFTNIKKILAISENTKKSLLEIGIKEDRIVKLPPAVGHDFFSNTSRTHDKRAELGIPESDPVVLYIGNWAGWKGVDVLIESLVEIRRELPNVKLITAWGEPYSWYDERKDFIFEKIRKLQLDGTVVSVGIVDNIRGLIEACDVFVAPFLNTDGVSDLPLTILESMACGRPVVATKVGGVPEIVTHKTNGLLVRPGDPTELADALIYILKNRRDANRMGENARDFASKNHSLEVVAKRLESVYTGIACN